MNIRKIIKKLPIRLIISVIVGIAIAMILSIITHLILYWLNVFPKRGEPMFETNLLWISLVYHSFYAVVGAYFTAMIAENTARKAVFILGTKEAIMWLLGTILLWKHAAPWYNVTKALLGIPLAILGGKIYAACKKKKDAATHISNKI